MDDSYDPCYNFYAFACGGFYKKSQNSRLKGSDSPDVISPFTKIENKIHEGLKVLLEQKHDKKTEPRTFLLVKRFYKTCISSK